MKTKIRETWRQPKNLQRLKKQTVVHACGHEERYIQSIGQTDYGFEEGMQRRLTEDCFDCQVRQEAARQRRNRNARERHAAMKSLGLTKTPYGWE